MTSILFFKKIIHNLIYFEYFYYLICLSNYNLVLKFYHIILKEATKFFETFLLKEHNIFYNYLAFILEDNSIKIFLVYLF